MFDQSSTVHQEMLIPCELCNRLVAASRYTRHLQQCFYTRTLVLSSAMFVIPTTDEYSYEECLEISDTVGTVPVGVSHPDAALGPLQAPAAAAAADDSAADCCPICLTEPVDTRTVQCGHSFCEQCIRRWMRDHHSCPICLTDLNSETHVRVP